MGFEIDSLDNDVVVKNTFDVAVIEDAEGEPVSGFKIVGRNSPQYREQFNKVRIANTQRGSKRKKPLDTSTEEGAEILARTLDGNEDSLIMAVIVDWFGFNVEGQPATFDRARAERLLTKYPTWKDKIKVALDNDANFIKV